MKISYIMMRKKKKKNLKRMSTHLNLTFRYSIWFSRHRDISKGKLSNKIFSHHIPSDHESSMKNLIFKLSFARCPCADFLPMNTVDENIIGAQKILDNFWCPTKWIQRLSIIQKLMWNVCIKAFMWIKLIVINIALS